MTDILASVPQILLTIASGVGIAVVIMLPCVAITWWAHRRDQRRWAVHEQVLAMEPQMREESMSEAWREWRRQWRQQQADIAREARCRLGSPEEEADG